MKKIKLLLVYAMMFQFSFSFTYNNDLEKCMEERAALISTLRRAGVTDISPYVKGSFHHDQIGKTLRACQSYGLSGDTFIKEINKSLKDSQNNYDAGYIAYLQDAFFQAYQFLLESHAASFRNKKEQYMNTFYDKYNKALEESGKSKDPRVKSLHNCFDSAYEFMKAYDQEVFSSNKRDMLEKFRLAYIACQKRDY